MRAMQDRTVLMDVMVSASMLFSRFYENVVCVRVKGQEGALELTEFRVKMGRQVLPDC